MSDFDDRGRGVVKLEFVDTGPAAASGFKRLAVRRGVEGIAVLICGLRFRPRLSGQSAGHSGRYPIQWRCC